MTDVQQIVTKHFDMTAGEFDSIYTGAGKGFLGRLLDRALRQDMYDRFRLAIEACGDAKGRTVLEVGCGTGRFVIALAERGAHVVGLDPAPAMLAIASDLARKQGVAERCEFVEGDLDHYETDRRFDFVLGIGLFDYLADPAAALRKMTKLTGERLILTFPRRWTYRAPIRKMRLSLRGCPVFFYDRNQVMWLIEQAGGKVERFEVVGKLYFVTASPMLPAATS